MYLHTTDVHNTKAAEEILPLILQYIKPSSVVDVGCGIGTWLKVFSDYIGDDYLGIDSYFINKELLFIPQNKFRPHDLRTPFKIERKFDLALSLEVAEHLPESSADIFIDSLSNLSDNILFSAAIPNQGGQNHLNEQWPEYWIKKLEQRDFRCFDIIRPLVWDNPNVDLWYKQNILFFSRTKNNFDAVIKPSSNKYSIVHPEMFQIFVDRYNNILKGDVGFRQLYRIILNTLKKRVLKK
ncbi:MAG: hypothetical protein B6D44_13220 [Ignavibacteriales bacterium UTCHB2]|jgi:SAM-dependent methyltransferase|nr:MAG: hypothetical protein B6D44_13220 [Ignavibacteriales bacterium UTCHB2]